MASSGAMMSSSSKVSITLIFIIVLTSFVPRKGKLVTSEEAKALQARTWEEILGVLRKQIPDIDSILHG
jgi:hypothetical protein